MAHLEQSVMTNNMDHERPGLDSMSAKHISGLDLRIVERFRRLAIVCGGIAITVAILAGTSWVTGIEVLRTFVSGRSEVKPNTALALLAAGLALCILQSKSGGRGRLWIARVLASLTLAVGGLSALEYVLERDFDIDNVLLRIAGSDFVTPRMAPHTALALVFAGITVLLLSFQQYRTWRLVSQTTAFLTGISALVALLGYTFDVTPIYKLGEPALMALPTCIALGFLSLGSFLSSAEWGLLEPMANRGGGGLMLRRVLPLAMIAPLVLAWWVTKGAQWGLYGKNTDNAVFAFAIVIVLFWLLYWNACALNRLDEENERSRETLRQSSEQWGLTFNCMSEGLSYHDPDYNILGVNTAFQKLVPDEGGVGEKCYRLIHGTDAPPEDCPMRRSLATGETSSSEIYEPRLGKHLRVRTDPVRDSSGEVFRIVHVVEDITERKQAEEHIRRLASIVESSEDAIYSVSSDGKITSWNRGAEVVFGYKAEEVIGRTPRMLYPPDREEDYCLAIHDSIMSGRHIENAEMLRVRKDGSQFYVSISISPLRDLQGNVVGSSAIARDITERKRAEAEIQKLNAELEDRVQQRTSELEVANKELEAFSYSVSHDLRAPLRSLDGFSQILLEEYGEKFEGEGRDFLKRLRGASQQMGHLIDALLQLSRVSRSEMERTTVNLSDMARQIATELQKTAPDRLVQFDIAQNVTALGDARLLHAALQNLIGNAWKFTSKREEARIDFGVVKKDGKRVFFVRDNGAGFEMQYANKLFGAFQRLHSVAEFEGSGIGLATVQRIVRRHGGSVWAEGEPNVGATFYFTLP